MRRRTRRLLGFGLPVLLVAAGTGAFIGYQAYRTRCSTGFPDVAAVKVGLPRWRQPADADRVYPTDADRRSVGPIVHDDAYFRGLDDLQSATAEGARAASGVGPFGVWVSAAYYTDEDKNLFALQPVGFLGDDLIVAVGGGLPAASSRVVAAVDPVDGTLRWARRNDSGSPIDASTFVALSSENAGSTVTSRVAAIDRAGGLTWCTELPPPQSPDALTTTRLDNDDLALLYRADGARSEKDSAMLVRLEQRTGRARSTVTMPRFAQGIAADRMGLDAFGDQVLLSPSDTLSAPQLLTAATAEQPVIAVNPSTGHETWRYVMRPPADGQHWMQSVITTADDTAVVVGALVGKPADGPVRRFRLAGIDRSGHERWHVDDVSWQVLTGPHPRTARRFGDFLVVQTQEPDTGSQLRAYRIADGTIAWTAPLSVRTRGLADAAEAGSFLLVPSSAGTAVVDLRSGREVGVVGALDDRRWPPRRRTTAMQVVANDRFIVVSGERGLLIWRRAA
ncbi:outer membrane protein assembly factor BamB family protein [Micromonosporaceae bacterium Da 78-11]